MSTSAFYKKQNDYEQSFFVEQRTPFCANLSEALRKNTDLVFSQPFSATFYAVSTFLDHHTISTLFPLLTVKNQTPTSIKRHVVFMQGSLKGILK